MALIIPASAKISEIGLLQSSQDNLPHFFKLVSDDIILNIFSRVDGDPRYLARLACVCRRFSYVVRNVCWKQQCTRIVPEIMPSPHAQMDQIPDPPGGWGALMKLLVCCPGLKHAGVVKGCWDFGLENELGPSELYEVQPRSSVKKTVEVHKVPGTGCGELRADEGGASVQRNREFSDSTAVVERECVAGGDKQVRNLVVPVEKGKSAENDSPATLEADQKLSAQSYLPSDSSVALNQKLALRNAQVGTLKMTEKFSVVDPSATLRAVSGSGRPPRQPVKRVRWNEEEGPLNDEKVESKKLQPARDSGGLINSGRSRKRKERALRRILSKIPEDPKQRLHVVTAKWKSSREEGSRLLANRFRCDSLYVCDWPGCEHPGEKRSYKLFRGFVKNFKTSLLWRNLKDMKAKQASAPCAFCSSPSTWDMSSTFCLRRSFEYHDDGEPVVQACVCENGHVSGAWTNRSGFYVSLS